MTATEKAAADALSKSQGGGGAKGAGGGGARKRGATEPSSTESQSDEAEDAELDGNDTWTAEASLSASQELLADGHTVKRTKN